MPQITIRDLFKFANNYTPKDKRAHQNIVADFSNVAQEKVEKETKNLEKKCSEKEIQKLLDQYSTSEWIEITTISSVYSPNPKYEELLKFTPKQRTILAIKKLDIAKDIQFKAWKKFVSQFNDKSIDEEIKNFEWIIRRTPLDCPNNIKILHILKAVKEQLSWKSDLSIKHIVAWVFWLLADKWDRTIKLYHLSDTIKDWDTAQRRIQSHYNILERKYWVSVDVEFHWSAFWRSFQTWAQAAQIIAQSSELAKVKHWLKTCPKLFIMVNNASRSKHKNKEKAQWSKCLWARVQDWRSMVVHEVIWVDNDVFSMFKNSIIELFVVEWMPWDPHYSDLSTWSQFRSLYNFPYVQFLNAISEWWCPAWFRVKEIDIDKNIPDLEIASNEAILLDPDHYGNGKSLSAHKNWVVWLCNELWVKLDHDSIIASFYHPDTDELLAELELIATEYLWKHTWKKCIWNWSSQNVDWTVFIEIWISAEKPWDKVKEVVESPIWTRVVFKKK